MKQHQNNDNLSSNLNVFHFRKQFINYSFRNETKKSFIRFQIQFYINSYYYFNLIFSVEIDKIKDGECFFCKAFFFSY